MENHEVLINILSVLQEIRDLLKGQKGETKQTDLIAITDGPGKKTSEIIAELRKNFPVEISNEENIDTEFPEPNKRTTRYFKKLREADEGLQNKSAEDLEKEGIECITLRERMIFELLYFKETGWHLDATTATLCAGSRDSNGLVPSVDWRYWGSGLFRVDRYNVRTSEWFLRARVVKGQEV